jgi:hypothetical protein
MRILMVEVVYLQHVDSVAVVLADCSAFGLL